MWRVPMRCAGQHPHYRPIARHHRALSELFVQAHRLCKRPRLVGLGTLAVNGTKLRANASFQESPDPCRSARLHRSAGPRKKLFCLPCTTGEL
jgi:hypothetical protein